MSAAALTPVLLDAALKGTAVLVAAVLAAVLLRRASAAAKHLLWALCVAALLALPVLGALLPRWTLPVSAPWSEAGGQQAEAAEPGGLLLPHARHLLVEPATVEPVLVATSDRAAPAKLRVGETPPCQPEPETQPQATPAAPLSWPLAIWGAGAALGLAWIGLGFLSLALLRRRCRTVTDGAAFEMTAELAGALGIRRRVRLLESDRRRVPMTWGILRPVVLLPREARDWSGERLRLVLLHELGHVRRWDCLTQLLAHLTRALYWFHPLAWFAVARLKAEQEQACDDVVLDGGACAADYAGHLLAVTAGLRADVFAAPVALGMGRASRIRRRLVTLLDDGRNRRPLRRRAALAAALLAAALVLPLSVVDFGAAAPAPAQQEPAAAQDKDKDKKEGEKAEQAGDPLKRLDEVRAKLAKSYVTPLDEKKLAEDAIRGMIKSLKDPHTDYISDEEYAQMQAQFQGALTGIGVQIKQTDGALTVVTPLEGSPALKAGIRPGDTIEAIDGKATSGIKLADAVKLILGPEGAEVKLRVVHGDGVVEDVKVTRRQVRFRSVHGFRRGDSDEWRYLIDPEHKVGYVQILQFGGKTAGEVRAAIEKLQKDGMKGLILDLRYCPGGLLTQAVGVAELLLPKGVIVTTRGSDGGEHRYEAEGKGYLGDFPMVVVVNEATASSAEIVAGALRDHKRAVVVGTRTYGKGSVQALMKLEAGGVLRLTTAHHYLPSGRNIHKRPGEKSWGVDPNDGFYLPLTKQQNEGVQKAQTFRATVGWKKDERPKWPERITPKYLEEKGDPQLAAALRTMVARLTGGEFIKVGKSEAALREDVLRLEDLRRRRETLQEDLERLEREIADIQKAGGRK